VGRLTSTIFGVLLKPLLQHQLNILLLQVAAVVAALVVVAVVLADSVRQRDFLLLRA
jgi:hypothetical protein